MTDTDKGVKPLHFKSDPPDNQIHINPDVWTQIRLPNFNLPQTPNPPRAPHFPDFQVSGHPDDDFTTNSIRKETSTPDVVIQWMQKLVHVFAAIGAQVRHQQVSVVECQQVIINVSHADITQVLPPVADITSCQPHDTNTDASLSQGWVRGQHVRGQGQTT